jgi:uncharacterized protein (TIGR02271 family)
MAHNTVVGIFPDQSAAQEVVQDLKQRGFSESDIHVSNEPEKHHGGFVRWMEHLFGGGGGAPEASEYQEALRRGECVVAVDADDETIESAADIMEQHGAIEVGDSDGEPIEGTSAGSRTSRNTSINTSQKTSGNIPPRTESTRTNQNAQSIPVVEEQLNVGKRTVIRGGVRVYSHVTEQPVEEQVRLREENVRVERRPVDRPVTSTDQSALRDQTIEVTATREEPVISKTRRVVEEVIVGKESNERTETIRDNIRKTDVKVEPLQSETQQTQTSSIPTECSLDFQNNFRTQYGSTGAAYPEYRGSYEYGYRMAGDPRYKGKKFEDIEQTLRTDYMRQNPNSSWDRMKGAIRYGWERMTGKR